MRARRVARPEGGSRSPSRSRARRPHPDNGRATTIDGRRPRCEAQPARAAPATRRAPPNRRAARSARRTGKPMPPQTTTRCCASQAGRERSASTASAITATKMTAAPTISTQARPAAAVASGECGFSADCKPSRSGTMSWQRVAATSGFAGRTERAIQAQPCRMRESGDAPRANAVLRVDRDRCDRQFVPERCAVCARCVACHRVASVHRPLRRTPVRARLLARTDAMPAIVHEASRAKRSAMKSTNARTFADKCRRLG